MTAETCNFCGDDISGAPTVKKYRGEKLVETLCQTCSNNEMIAKYGETKILTISMIMLAISEPHRFAYVLKSYNSLRGAIKVFEELVWHCHAGLRDKGEDRKITRNGLTLEIAYMAGRAQIELTRGDTRILMITDALSEEHTMGLQGIYATEAQAFQLLCDAVRTWMPR